MTKALRKLRNKIKNLVEELHKKIIHFLVSQYEVILLPEFRVQDMIRKKDRKLK